MGLVREWRSVGVGLEFGGFGEFSSFLQLLDASFGGEMGLNESIFSDWGERRSTDVVLVGS